MKKSILLFFMMAMCSGVFAQKIAHVYPSKIMEDMQDYKDAMADIEKMQRNALKRLSKMDSTYKDLLRQYQEGKNLSEIQKKVLEQDIMDLEQRYPKAEQEEQQKIQGRQQQYMALISEKIQTAIKTVGEAGEYTYVMDGSALLYAGSAGKDITDEVRKQLGLEPLSTN